jgi:single-stranded DNA-binding protein
MPREVVGLGLTKGNRVTVEGVWSKRSWTTKDGQRRITDVLTVNKLVLFKQTEISRSDVATDDGPTSDEAAPAAGRRFTWKRSGAGETIDVGRGSFARKDSAHAVFRSDLRRRQRGRDRG